MDAIGQCLGTNSMEISICWPVTLMARSLIIMGEGIGVSDRALRTSSQGKCSFMLLSFYAHAGHLKAEPLCHSAGAAASTGSPVGLARVSKWRAMAASTAR